MIIIDDGRLDASIFPADFGRGYVERDYKQYPQDMFRALPSEMQLIPQTEWSARIKEQTETKSSLAHIRDISNYGDFIPSMDQNGHGYCWAYSTGMCVQLLKAKQGQPYTRLNPHAVAAIIKGGRDEGGWCGLSAKFLREVGIPTEAYWPKHSRSLQYDTPEMRTNAAKNRTTEDWADLTQAVYDQNLTFNQVATCLLLNIPVALDFNWWGHSVCGMRLVEVESNSFGIEIINSWTDNWGTRGTAILRGSKAIPNGAIALCVANAA